MKLRNSVQIILNEKEIQNRNIRNFKIKESFTKLYKYLMFLDVIGSGHLKFNSLIICG